MIVHKIDKNNKPICKSINYKSSIVSYFWIQVNCKQCRIINEIAPKLAKIQNTINSYELKLQKLRIIEKTYLAELTYER